MYRQKLFAVIAASLTLASSQAFTEDLVEDELIVTATRTSQSIDDSLASVTLISSEDIARLQPIDMLDLLSRTPGIDISRNGGRGSIGSLYLRGSNDGHTLVLIDGVRMGSATLGEASLEYLDPSQVERIEVVRGPRSSLYGSEALGGVIQVFTRKSGDDFKPTITLGYGSHNTFETAGGIGGTLGNTDIKLDVSHIEADGIDSQVFDGNTDADDDGYSNTTISASLLHNFDNGSDASLTYYTSFGEKEFDQGDTFSADPDSIPYTGFKVESFNAAYSIEINKLWRTGVEAGFSKDKNETLDDGTDDYNKFSTRRYQFGWQNDFQVSENYLLTLGYDYYQDKVTSTTAYGKNSRYNHALFGQLQGDVTDGINFAVGARGDKNEQFGSKTTYNIGLGFDLGDLHRLILSHGTAFKAPTFNALYWPADFFSAGNPSLIPEKSVNFDAEVRGNYDAFNWSLSVYHNEVTNLIEWAETAPWFWQPSNVAGATLKGAEFSLSTELLGWQCSSTYSVISPEDDENGNILARRARQTLVFDIDRNFEKLSVGLGFKAQDHRYDDAANTVRLGGYGLVNIHMRYIISNALSLKLKVDNLLDNNYQLSKNYQTDGATAMVSVTYRM